VVRWTLRPREIEQSASLYLFCFHFDVLRIKNAKWKSNSIVADNFAVTEFFFRFQKTLKMSATNVPATPANVLVGGTPSWRKFLTRRGPIPLQRRTIVALVVFFGFLLSGILAIVSLFTAENFRSSWLSIVSCAIAGVSSFCGVLVVLRTDFFHPRAPPNFDSIDFGKVLASSLIFPAFVVGLLVLGGVAIPLLSFGFYLPSIVFAACSLIAIGCACARLKPDKMLMNGDQKFAALAVDASSCANSRWFWWFKLWWLCFRYPPDIPGVASEVAREDMMQRSLVRSATDPAIRWEQWQETQPARLQWAVADVKSEAISAFLVFLVMISLPLYGVMVSYIIVGCTLPDKDGHGDVLKASACVEERFTIGASIFGAVCLVIALFGLGFRRRYTVSYIVFGVLAVALLAAGGIGAAFLSTTVVWDHNWINVATCVHTNHTTHTPVPQRNAWLPSGCSNATGQTFVAFVTEPAVPSDFLEVIVEESMLEFMEANPALAIRPTTRYRYSGNITVFVQIRCGRYLPLVNAPPMVLFNESVGDDGTTTITATTITATTGTMTTVTTDAANATTGASSTVPRNCILYHNVPPIPTATNSLPVRVAFWCAVVGAPALALIAVVLSVVEECCRFRLRARSRSHAQGERQPLLIQHVSA
jgi:hypothetical protein